MTGRSGPTAEGSPPRLAIIGPSFFSYVPAIAETLRERGLTTAVYDEKHSNSLLSKLLYRLGLYNHRLSPRQAHLDRLLTMIAQAGVTDVFLVNTETVDRGFVQRLTQDGVRVHLYMWDGVANKPGFVRFLDLLTSRGSFDPEDCERFGLTYIPLFAEPVFDEARQRVLGSTPSFDIGFCGTVHSSRTGIVAKLLEALRSERCRVRLMLYYHSRALLYAKGLAQPAVWWVARSVSYQSFAKDEIARMFANSWLVLDVPHPGQTGMTARTFEVLMAGARLLTFNRRAAELLPASLRRRIHVVTDIDEALAFDFSELPALPPLSTAERYFLSLDRFVDQLLKMAQLAQPCGASPENRRAAATAAS